MKLYELTSEYQRILNALEDTGGEITDAQAAELDALDGALETKIESIVKMALSLEAEADAIEAEKNRLAKRAQSLNNRATWLKNYVMGALLKLGREKVKGTVLSVSLCKSPPSCTVLDSNLVDTKYKSIKAEEIIDKQAAIADFKATGAVPAGMKIEVRQHVRIQ